MWVKSTSTHFHGKGSVRGMDFLFYCPRIIWNTDIIYVTVKGWSLNTNIGRNLKKSNKESISYLRKSR